MADMVGVPGAQAPMLAGGSGRGTVSLLGTLDSAAVMGDTSHPHTTYSSFLGTWASCTASTLPCPLLPSASQETIPLPAPQGYVLFIRPGHWPPVTQVLAQTGMWGLGWGRRKSGFCRLPCGLWVHSPWRPSQQ